MYTSGITRKLNDITVSGQFHARKEKAEENEIRTRFL